MITLHLISHTHWDREWYLPFQIFRLKLVQLVDDLLDLMAADHEYRHFMLDGQTIILEDYLHLRPEREPELRELIRRGRLLIGPWHILPDEFLVSPEALVRNLLEGDHLARRFRPKMQVGYIPDPFGHIGQMPQILRGFGISTASVQRGLSDEPCEFWWEAPDGSRVLMAYLRDGYGNAALLPTEDPKRFVQEAARLRDSLLPHAATSHLLLMHGTDHMPASPATSAAIAATKDGLNGDCLVHSTLPDYFAAIQEEIRSRNLRLPVRVGELRDCQRSPLLPGVLSSRVWIKQRNHACETLLEKWAEPFSVFAEWAAMERQTAPARGFRRPETALRQAWRYLLENQPHDSICGCSIDQTHEEMRPRFDAAEQIAGEITHQSLEAIAGLVDTRPPAALGEVLSSAVIVFNPTGGRRADWVCVDYPLPAEVTACEVVDESGRAHPAWVGARQKREIASLVLDKQGLAHLLASVSGGKISGLPAGLPAGAAIQSVALHRSEKTLHIQVALADTGAHRAGVLEQAQVDLQQILADPSLEQFIVQVSLHSAQLHLVAEDLPAHGYRTFWVRPTAAAAAKKPSGQPHRIENEFFVVQASPTDGSLTLLDKRTGVTFSGLNRLVDGGDCGDEYNYCPPAQDQLVAFRLIDLQTEGQPAGTQLTLRLEADLPAGLTPDRARRSPQTIPVRVTSRIRLLPGVPRLDFETEVENTAADHRLRVHFPAPFAVQEARYDGHYEVVRRPVGVPVYSERWAEQPRPEQPMREFCEISQDGTGLMVAARGLREVEVLTDGQEWSEIALTLLRCIGWLSRDDFPARASQAGPGLPTPGAQMIGSWRFAYSVIPHPGDWLTAAQQAAAFNVPLQAARTRLQDGPLPNQTSFLAVDASKSAGQAFALTAIKKAEDGGGWIVRGCNVTGDPLEVSLKPCRKFASAERTRLDEQPLEPLAVEPDGSLTLQVRGHEIVTLRLQAPA